MSDLQAFTPEEKELVFSTLYKVGVWISHAEDESGEEDDEKEMAALSACVQEVAKKYDGPGLVDDIARGVLKRRERWENWANYSFNVLVDVKKALAVVRAHGSEQDLKNYKAALVEVAVTVAQAYGEFGDYEDEESGGFKAMLGKITSGFKALGSDDAGHPMNVSAVEDEHINQLKEVLKEA